MSEDNPGGARRSDLEDLNARFGALDGIAFRDLGDGIVVADVSNASASASFCMQGAHLLSWTPRTQREPVVWVSDAARYAKGKAVRGGIPVCWPWFGPHPTDPAAPSHGYVRAAAWTLAAVELLPGGDTRVSFERVDDASSRRYGPHSFALSLRATIGAELAVELETTNRGASAFSITEALHTYLAVDDIGDIAVAGLDGATYVDQVDAGRRKRCEGDVRFAGEVDRVFVGTTATCVVEDPGFGRRIVVEKSGSRSTVVWSPWLEKARRLGDLGEGRRALGGWREMLCVETANALDDVVAIAPGATHRMGLRLRVEARAPTRESSAG
ncbi:MAG TPA: D-hexose-6-phosphate mutarotase [Burkholderiaceae bacterium]|nr:D-hexose-6-phosphate mutarotase [Burkholderiaceae bacterium]